MSERITVIKKSPRGGVGVFATKTLAPNDRIGTYKCIAAPSDEWGAAVDDYLFTRGKVSAMALGDGSLFNHSDTPNAKHEFPTMRSMKVYACKTISPGEEITISYGKQYWVSRPRVKVL